MAYIFTKSDNVTTVTINDGSIDDTKFTIKILGRNASNYGTAMAENLVHIVENFASTTVPALPTLGQIWFQKAAAGDGKIRVYDPINGNPNDLENWRILFSSGDTIDVASIPNLDASKITTGVLPIARGGTGTGTATGTGAVVLSTSPILTGNPTAPTPPPGDNDTSIATTAFVTNHTAGNFLPLTGGTLTGDLTVNKAAASIIVTSTTGQAFVGTATSSGIAAIGAASPNDAQLILYHGSIASGANVRWSIRKTGDVTSDLTVNAHDGAGTVISTPLIIKRATGELQVFGGTRFMSNNLYPNTNGNLSVGTASLKFGAMYANTFFGTATQAQYADLAERYHADYPYAPGTLVKLGGECEITQTTDDGDTDFFGVISTNPGFLLNAEAGTDQTHPAVALSGKVPVYVIGEVNKGDRLVPSHISGCARKYQKGDDYLSIIGRALEAKTSQERDLVNCVVGVK